MTPQYDTIIIGGGHNGLVTAATLAKAGQKVLLLEQRDLLGGAAATEEIFPGYHVNTGAPDANLLADEVIRDLALRRHGLVLVETDTAVFAPQLNGRGLTLYRDDAKTAAELAHFSQRDADRWPAFAAQVRQLAAILAQMMRLTPPDITALSLSDLPAWGKVGLDVKRLGDKTMMELFRVLPMGLADYLNEWFESDALKGALAGSGIIGLRQGPRSAGTTLTFLYQQTAGLLRNRFVIGGMGKLMDAIAASARQSGATIRTGAGVQRILIEDGRAVGVELTDDAQISARNVASSADPVRTFMTLVGPQQLQPRFIRQARNIMLRGSTAQVHLALSGLPEFIGQTGGEQLHGHIRIAPSLDYVEQAYDAVKYGRIPPRPYLDATIPTVHDPSLAPAGAHIMSITMRYAPYTLQDGTWDSQREALGDLVVSTLAPYAPNLQSLISNRKMLTPLDWERDYALTEGSIMHGQMGLDQLLVMRPVPGYGRYATPITNLYLCGASAHPGGGVTGLPGYHAAHKILAGNKS